MPRRFTLDSPSIVDLLASQPSSDLAEALRLSEQSRDLTDNGGPRFWFDPESPVASAFFKALKGQPVAPGMAIPGRQGKDWGIVGQDRVPQSLTEPAARLAIHAMPGRLVLRFPPPVKEIRGIPVPETWALRRELGELVAMGEAVDARERKARREILRRSGNTSWQRWREKHLPTLNRLIGWKRPSAKFLVSMAIGTYYWRKELASFGDEFAFLADIRVYNITDLATCVVEVDE